ncbi:unnamed protein product [Rotaria socialis]
MGTGTHVGFIAQELQSIIPEMVTDLGTINGVDHFLENNQEGMNQLLVKSIQDLNRAKADTGSLASISGSLASQSLALSQMQATVTSLQSSSGANSVNSGTVINNYYNNTTVIQTGSTITGSVTTDPAYMTLVDMVASLSGSLSGQSIALAQLQAHVDTLSGSSSTISTGSINSLQWTHSGTLLDQVKTDTSTPRDVITYITDLFSHTIEIVRDFVALEITAIR